MRADGSALAKAAALAVTSAALYGLAFPPFELPGVAFVALAPLVLAATRVRPAFAAAIGVAWGVVAAFATAPWLPATLESRFGIGGAPAWLGLAAIGVFPAGAAMAGFCAWVSWCRARGVARVMAIAAGFGVFEAARSFGPTGVPWALLGASALPEPLVAWAGALGVFGLGMLAAAVNAAIALALSSERSSVRRFRSIALVTAAALAIGAATPEAPPRRVAGAERLRVAVVQPGVVPADEATPSGRAIALSRLPAARQADLVVWPEHAFPDYLREDTERTRRVLALSRELRGELVLGAPHYRYAQPEPLYYASAFLLRGGELRGRHDKTRLVPFAETRFTPGQRLAPLFGSRAPLGVLICAELLFSDAARQLARGGARVLVNPSNDAWLAPAASEYLLRLARLRALETGRPLIRATPTGISAVIDASGRVIARARSGGAELISAEIAPAAHTPWCLRFGDWPLGLAVAAVALTTLCAWRLPNLAKES
jgi:apolipoprotein N-acyltransferase